MKFHQGKYTPRNPEKYIGDIKNISYRSSWELKAMIWFDNQPNVLKWGSEEIAIPYISPIDNEIHRYFPDFIVMIKTRTDEIKKIVVEIKPAAQCIPPKKTKKTKRMITEVSTYLVNQAKWDAARKWCATNKLEFTILTERELNV